MFLHLDVNMQFTVLYIDIIELLFAQNDSLRICFGLYIFPYQQISVVSVEPDKKLSNAHLACK